MFSETKWLLWEFKALVESIEHKIQFCTPSCPPLGKRYSKNMNLYVCYKINTHSKKIVAQNQNF